MAKIRISYWKHIPLSVTAQTDRKNKVSIELPKIYMVTVDAVATKSGDTSTEDYAAGFRFEKEEREGEPQQLAEAIVAELVAKYPREWLWEQRDQAGVSAEDQALCEKEAE